ncbi:MAG: hypothetical protein RIQ56_211, partial [Candidatus Parcubacteria bacterium]
MRERNRTFVLVALLAIFGLPLSGAAAEST